MSNKSGHGVDSERIRSGYPATFHGSGLESDSKFFLKAGYGAEPDLYISRKKSLINEFLLYSSKIFIKQNAISG